MPRRLVCAIIALCALCLLSLQGRAAEFSPDGKQIAYIAPSGNSLTILNTDGTAPQPVPDGGDCAGMRWSPDGQHLLFVDRAGHLKLFDVQGRQTRQITENAMPPLAWREDSRRFAAVGKGDDGKSLQIQWFTAPDGTLTSHADLQVSSVAPGSRQMLWLPGTDNVAFLGGTPGQYDLYVTDSGDVHRATSSQDVMAAGLFEGGKRLIWARRSKNPGYVLLTLYSLGIDNRGAVTRLPFPARLPGINPDPRHAPKNVPAATFSPDGKWLTFAAEFSVPSAGKKTPPAAYSALYVVHPDGTGLRLVRKTPQNPSLVAFWSADSQHLGVEVRDDKGSALYLYDADGTGEKAVPTP